jgi:predicted ABC-type transport system involved in lysophospholipase L1 biosynthesis ATPase subunit
MPVLIEAENIHKSYVVAKTRLHVLGGVSLSVAAGEAVAVAGKSGAGKSTLLHILGGLDRPDDGSVSLQGRSLYALPGGERSRVRASALGFVFQSYHLLPEMDVLENVMLPAMARSRFVSPYSGMRRRAMDLLEAVGLADRAVHTPMELSGGEQQRVALARALMNDPQLVLADEPTGNLDAATGSQVLDCLFSLTRERGRTLIVVTHSESLAAMCDRTLRLRDGRVEADDPPPVAA